MLDYFFGFVIGICICFYIFNYRLKECMEEKAEVVALAYEVLEIAGEHSRECEKWRARYYELREKQTEKEG